MNIKTRRELLALPTISQQQVADFMGWSLPKVRNVVRQLKKEGYDIVPQFDPQKYKTGAIIEAILGTSLEEQIAIVNSLTFSKKPIFREVITR